MKPAPFLYLAPTTLDEALEALAEHGDAAKPLAGGQSLVPAMSFRLAQPAVLVDLNRIPDLAGIRELDAGDLTIGAMTRQRAIERSDVVARRAPLVSETMPQIAHPQIRNRGTFGGNLAHADPASELPAVARALQAQMVIARRGEQRSVSADDFYTGLFETALEPDELLVEVLLPALPEHSGWAFEEVSRRRGDYALVGVAVTVSLRPSGVVDALRIALLSVGEGPFLAAQAAADLVGEEPTEDLVIEVARSTAQAIDPPADIHATAAFRRHLARVITERALSRAAARARETLQT